jgi:hypothetical protein
VSSASSPITACKKKLYALNPARPPQYLPVQRTRSKQRTSPADPTSLERQVRQLLADKISGNQVGIWLLLPEHLRLGTWDLLVRWSGQPAQRVEPRLGLHLVNESALCLCSYRHGRTLSQKGFELANGLPFVPTDQAVHTLLDSHTVSEAQQLQVALGKLRRASQHFGGQLLAMDPHRMNSYTKRQMRRHRFNSAAKPKKMGQTFFLLDCQTGQPVCFTLASSAQSVVQATPELLRLGAEILSLPADSNSKPLVLADKEHYSQELFQAVGQQGCFDLLGALSTHPDSLKRWNKIPEAHFVPRWPGYATATQPYHFKHDPSRLYYELVQRSGLRKDDLQYQGFLSTVLRPEVQALTHEYPQRWQVEEFFKFNQALGWHRTGTLNLNVRYAQLTMSLLAQAAIHQLRQRLGPPVADWDATHLARNLFEGLEGDLRVREDTIVVTFYNAPNTELLRAHYQNLPDKLRQQGVDPHIPWLYNFELDFRFK